MPLNRYKLAASYISFYLLVLASNGYQMRASLFTGMYRLAVFLAYAALLLFVFERSTKLGRILETCLGLFSGLPCALPANRGLLQHANNTSLLPEAPSLSPLFERPPPSPSF